MERPFWEEAYKDKSITTFGLEPNQTIVAYEHLFDKQGCVLDVGCGEGQNALYLAGRGFSMVEAFDLSGNAIEKLQNLAKANAVSVKAWADDLCTFRFSKPYSLVFSFGTLHFVKKDDWRSFIQRAKAYTVIGGVHVMQLFTNQVPASADIAPFAVGLADDGEIKEQYADWKILDFKSYVFEDEHPGVPKHVHASNKIIAQRIK